MIESFSIKFFLKPAKVVGGKNQIYVRIIVNREKVEFSTKLSIKQSEWREDSGRAFKSNTINDELSEIEADFRKIRRQILDKGERLTAKAIKRYYKGEKQFNKGILEYFDTNVKELELYASTGKLSKGTIKNYNTTSTHLNYFIKNVKKQNDNPMGEIEYSFINEFDIYLKTITEVKKVNQFVTIMPINSIAD